MRIVICVEGDSDKKFIEDFVNYNKFALLTHDIDYIISGGKNSLDLIKNNLVQPDQEGFNIIIQDLDLDIEDERRKKVDFELDGFNFKLFFIKSGNLNCLDELLESSVTNSLNEFDTCWNNFNECLSPIEFVENKLGMKDKLHLYKLMCLSVAENKQRMKYIGDKKIDYTSNRFFNLDHECFNDLKNFFDSI